jgi:hypothetical protein
MVKGSTMTGYTVHTGSTEKFSAGWDQIFKKNKGGKAPAKLAKPAAKKKSAVAASRSKARKPAKKKSARH